MSVARGSFAGRALGLGAASVACRFATRAGVDRSWNLELTSDMRGAVILRLSFVDSSQDVLGIQYEIMRYANTARMRSAEGAM